jgi:uncharacterized protein
VPPIPHTEPTTTGSAPKQTTIAPLIDPRTVHLFRRAERDYLYDVTSGRLAEVNPFARTVVELAAACGIDAFREALPQRVGGIPVDTEAALGILGDLSRQGFFRFVPFRKREQEVAQEALWAHRPRRLQLLFAQMCNLKCRYCYEEANGSNARSKLMTFEMARTCVDYLTEKSGPRMDLQITFFGGEPLLNFKVMQQVVDYCRDVRVRTGKSFAFETITNGTLLNRKVVDYFVANQFLLMISLDGYREMNNFNRPSANGRDYFDKIVANAIGALHAYRAAGLSLPVKVRANLTHAHHDLIRTVRFLEDKGFTTIGVAAIDNLPWSVGEQQACTEPDLDEIEAQNVELIETAYAKAKANERLTPYEGKLLNQVLERAQTEKSIRGLKCGVGRNTNIVDTEGNLYPCHRYGNLGSFVLGNVRTGGLDRERMMTYYRVVNSANSTKCQSCWVRMLCSGMCAWELSRPDGTVFEPHENRCRRIRRGFEEVMLFRRRVEIEAPHMIPANKACGTSCACPTSSAGHEEE